MILMGMADEDGRRTGPIQRRWQQASGTLRRIEWPPGIEDKAVAIRMLDFDAASANLVRAAVDGQLQGQDRVSNVI
jgi:hypothetical protein